MEMFNFKNMDITGKCLMLFLTVMIIVIHTSEAGIDEDMQALENDLKLEDMKTSQKKSIQDMTTDELIAELKKGIDQQEKKSHTERFHDIVSKNEADNDFEKLLREKVLKADETKTEQKKKVSSQQKKSSNTNMEANVISNEKPADENEKKETSHEKEENDEASLVNKAIATMEELRGADVNDRAAQKKGLDLLQQLIKADAKASKKRSSKNIVEKIRIAKEDAEKRKTAMFAAAMKADTEMMKKIAEEKAKAAVMKKRAENIKKSSTNKDTKKSVEKIVDNNIVIAKGTLMDDVLNLMAEDLVREIAEKVAQKRAFHDKYIQASKDVCEDKRSDCHRLVDFCDKYKKKLKNVCAKSCRFCESCSDEWTGKLAHRCRIVVNQGMCPRKGVEKYCRKSCGYCKIPVEPKCSKTRYGCCWDKTTQKQDEKGSNCRPCKNQYKYVCFRFKDECQNTNLAGNFMRDHCPETCDVCSDTCRDDPRKAFYCPFWKKDLKWCLTRRDVMKHFCPVTCELC